MGRVGIKGDRRVVTAFFGIQIEAASSSWRAHSAHEWQSRPSLAL
jgi:hypothetical protein